MGGGDGSAAPLVAFYSWAAVFAGIVGYNPIGYLVSYIVYLITIYWLGYFLNLWKMAHGYKVLLIIHLTGSIVGASMFGYTHNETLLGFLIRFAFTMCFIVLFLLCDRWLLSRLGRGDIGRTRDKY